MSPRKRPSDTPAEKLPKKKPSTDDAPSPVAATTRASAAAASASKGVGSRRSGSASSPKGQMDKSAASSPETFSPKSNGGSDTIPLPPKTSGNKSEPSLKPAATKQGSSQRASPPVAGSKSPPDAPKAPAEQSTKSNSKTVWSQAVLVGLLGLLIVTNVLTLGLWVQSRLDVELSIRDLAVTSGAEEAMSQEDAVQYANPLSSLQRMLKGLSDEKQSLGAQLANLKEAVSKSEHEKLSINTQLNFLQQRLAKQERFHNDEMAKVQADRDAKEANSQHFENEAHRMMTERDDWMKSTRSAQQSLAEIKEEAEKKVAAAQAEANKAMHGLHTRIDQLQYEMQGKDDKLSQSQRAIEGLKKDCQGKAGRADQVWDE